MSFLGKTRAIPAQLVQGLGSLAYANEPLSIGLGGTGADTDAGARASLGLGSLATINAPLPVASGGTGANNATDARSNLELADGESTPTLTHVANISASTISDVHYDSNGKHVNFGMRITFDVINPSTYTELGINLPFGVSDFDLFTQASGTVTTADQAGLTYAVRADITNNRLALRGISGSGTGNYEFYVEGSYRRKP